MLSFFKRKSFDSQRLHVDIHSHLIPGIDDGVQSMDEAISNIKRFKELGYSKLITTPHILQDFYKNTPEIILGGLEQLKQELVKEKVAIEIEAAAEYYLDEHFIQLIDMDRKLLSFGDNYVLFETGFMNKPVILNEVVFKLKSKGYTPIMAHPERYGYVIQNFDLVEDLISRGVLMQVNINSLAGYYSKEVRKTAEKLIDNGLVHFIGSDCHNLKHLDVMESTINNKYYNKALHLNLLNHTL